MFVFVEYYNNYNVLKTDKTLKEFSNEFNRYNILASGDTPQRSVREIQHIHRVEKYNSIKSEFISDYLDKFPEYKL